MFSSLNVFGGFSAHCFYIKKHKPENAFCQAALIPRLVLQQKINSVIAIPVTACTTAPLG
jgi:hypothetical protein